MGPPVGTTGDVKPAGQLVTSVEQRDWRTPKTSPRVAAKAALSRHPPHHPVHGSPLAQADRGSREA